MTLRLKITEEEATALVARGEAVQQLLENALLREAIATVQEELVDGMKFGGTMEAREAMHARWVGLEAVLQQLQAILKAGRSAAETLEKKKRTKAKTPTA